MFRFGCWFLVVLVPIAGFSEPDKVTVVPRPLDRSEPGVYRYFFEAAPPVGMVMVIRLTAWRGGRVREMRDTVEYTSGENNRLEIVFRDPSQMDDGSNHSKGTSVKFEALHGGGEFTNMRVQNAQVENNVLIFDLVGDGREPQRYVYEGFLESYASAKARIAGLTEMPKKSDIVTGWTYTADVRERKPRD